MRKAISERLTELRTKINRINEEVFACCDESTPSPSFSVPTIIDQRPLIPLGLFGGVSRFKDREYFVWELQYGLQFLPMVEPPTEFKFDSTRDPRVLAPADFGRFVTLDPVREFFRGRPVNREEMVTNFGTEVIREGVTVADVLRILPPEARFENLEEMVDAVAQRKANAL